MDWERKNKAFNQKFDGMKIVSVIWGLVFNQD